ncbi:AAA family ATPase [Paenibacillus sp. N1-5-1-14]|uniref:AAA family ATPase n=1 Tax=Paenibacillus radicibacter TaxID=2972488 RepID=UPI002158AC33|nr:AAA family ATPase [Paenibacillus radicibacter]MCR8641443.1 AAA family ATPase [Paenibacillus radicibacter]
MSFDLSLLGVDKNIPKVNFLEYTGIFEAPEKFGKTAFAALYPNAILLAAEKGYMAQVINKKDINNWSDFVKFVDLLAKNREAIGTSVQTIIIDTVDELYPMASPYVVKRESINDQVAYKRLKDIPFGQGWTLVDEEFKKQIKRIISMGFTILYLTHSTVKNMKPKNAEAYDVYKSTMTDRCANIVYPACDYIIHGERRKVEVSEGVTELKRVLTVKGSDEAVAGNRVYFDEDIVFDSEEEAMEKFQGKFKEGIKRNLEKAGINTSLEKLEVQQLKEKEEQIKKYMVEEQVEIVAQTKEEIKDEIAKVLGNLNEEVKKPDVEAKFLELLGMKNFTKVEDIKKLQKALDYVKTLPTK